MGLAGEYRIGADAKDADVIPIDGDGREGVAHLGRREELERDGEVGGERQGHVRELVVVLTNPKVIGVPEFIFLDSHHLILRINKTNTSTKREQEQEKKRKGERGKRTKNREKRLN